MSCCICLCEIKDLSNSEFQCQLCNSGIICHICFRNIMGGWGYYNILRYFKKDFLVKNLKCPCCRQVNWKRLHNEIVNNIQHDIEKKREYNSAEIVFLKNYSLRKDDEFDDDEYRNNDNDNDNDIQRRIVSLLNLT